MIWIITAMAEEAEKIINLYKLQKFKQFNNISFYKNNNVVLVLSGIGKIQSAIATSILNKEFKLEKIINIWIAWFTGKEKKAKIWDVFIITEVYQHDWYLPFEWNHLDYFKKWIKLQQNYNFKIKKNFNIFKWICATWDQFIDNEKKVEEIKEKYNADVIEMEAFAIASACREFNLLNKLNIIKAISDDGSKNAITDHEKNLDLAMNNSVELLKEIVWF
jgi:adenosylhomocysteine nucleosidase